jgi:hypothetical protein
VPANQRRDDDLRPAGRLMRSGMRRPEAPKTADEPVSLQQSLF